MREDHCSVEDDLELAVEGRAGVDFGGGKRQTTHSAGAQG